MTVAFTGHRPDKIAGYRAAPQAVEAALRRALADEIKRQADDGADCFLCGMAPGVDLWAADELLSLRRRGLVAPNVTLVAAVPFRAFADSFAPDERELYDRVAAEADRVVYISDDYDRKCYNRRNDYLVDNARLVIAYCEGRAGGTRYTIARARRQSKKVINVFNAELF